MTSAITKLTGLLLSLWALPASGQTADYGDFFGFPGASSNVNTALYLGASVDADTETTVIDPLTGLILSVNAATDVAATSDDLTGLADEDGSALPSSLVQGARVTIPITVFNNTGANAFFNAWIDFNNNGALEDILVTAAGGEKLTNELAIGSSPVPTILSVTFIVPEGAATGAGRGVRFRLTSVSNPGATGAAGDGEVEDYIIQVTPAGFVYGISGGSIYQINVTTGQGILAADIVPAISSSGNALAFAQPLGVSGVLIYAAGTAGDLRLGVWDRATGAGNLAGDLKSFGMPSTSVIHSGAFYAGYYWTILDNSDDLWKVTLSGASGNYTITAASKVCDLWSNARAHGFGDLVIRPDGTMLALGERTSTDSTEFFTANLSLPVPVASQLGIPAVFQNGIALGRNGRLYGGLGLSSANNDWFELDPSNGSTLNRIVNGNLDGMTDLTIAAPDAAPALVPPEDFGDSSVLASASSLRMNNLRLGALTDSEASASTNLTATGDDITGSDDEDGVTMPASITRGTTVTIPVSVFNNTIPSSYLNAWIDFNNDGILNDVLVSAGGEKLINQIAIASSGGASTQNITFTVPATASLGSRRAVRFRLTSIPNPTPKGPAGSGEVEDYTVTIASPTAPITLGDFVFLDVDGNARQSSSDTGIRGAAVKLYSSTDTTRGNGDDKLVGQAITDANGLYQFGGAGNVNMLIVGGTPTTITVGPAAAADDAEETTSTGAVILTDNDLELGDDAGSDQLAGLRFPGVSVPAGATITAASIQFMADESQAGAVTFSIEGEDADNTAPYTSTVQNLSTRPRTSSSAVWSPPDWNAGEKGANQLTPGLAPVVQEIVRRSGWKSGNALGFFIRRIAGTGRRTAETQASGSAQWAVLSVTYVTGATAVIQPNSRYFITLASSDAALKGLGPVKPWFNGGTPADPNVQTGQNVFDSNGILTGAEVVASVLTFAAGGSNTSYDFGFFPTDDYGDFAGFPSASSARLATLKIGTLSDVERSDAASNATATGDDVTGSDDEDGVAVPASVIIGQTGASITVTTTNTSGSAAHLNAWVDFNGDRDVLDAGEQIASDISIPNGTTNVSRIITFNVPSNAAEGSSGLRVRLTSVKNPGSDGTDGNGEVEDYVTNIVSVRFDTIMEVTPAGTASWSPGIAMEAGLPADFRLTITNSGKVALRDPIVINLLPAPGDTGAVDLTPRGSAWRPFLASSASAPTGFRPLYSLVQNPKRPEVLTPDPAGSVAPAWFALPANPGTVRSLKFDGTGLTLAPGARFTLMWTMSIPWDAAPLTRAWNSAGVALVRTDTGTRMAPSETPRASIQVLPPTGQLYGDKVWNDSNNDGLQSAGEAGLNGVRVELYRDNGDGISDPFTDTFVDNTYTADISGQPGSYRFGHFPAGSYFAFFAPSDKWTFAASDTGINDTLDSDAYVIVRGGRRSGLMPVTTIDPGEQDLTWDAGLKDQSGAAAVWAIANTAGGSMVLGGRFTKSHGVPRRNITLVNAAGAVDSTFYPGTGFDDTVRSLAIRSDGMIWAGGSFSSYNGNPTAGIALLSPTGEWDSRPAQPDTTFVNWVGTSGSSMFLAGKFSRVGGIPCGNVAKLKPDGSVDTTFNSGTGASGPIYDGAVLPNGNILLAGAFRSFNGSPTAGIVRLKSNGIHDTSFNPGVAIDGEIFSIRPIEDGRIALTGSFHSFNGIACNGAIRLSKNGQVDTTMQRSGLNVRSINASN